MIPEDMEIGTEFIANSGCRFYIVEYVSGKEVYLKSETGYLLVTQSSHIRRGKMRDPYFPTVFGKGYLGEGITKEVMAQRDIHQLLGIGKGCLRGVIALSITKRNLPIASVVLVKSG